MPSFADHFTSKLQGDFVAKQDSVIKEALAAAGFNPDDHFFIADNFTWVQCEGDPFNHFYYHFGLPDARRLISFQRVPYFDMGSIEDGNFKQGISAQYY